MSFPRYPKYKESGVEWLGQVPEHWEVKPFKHQIERNDGGVWGEDPDGINDTIVLRSTEQTVDGHWKIDDPAPRKLTDSEITNSLLAENDLLLTKSSGSSLHIGKTTIVTAEIAEMRCCYSNFMQRIRLRPELMPKLGWYFLNNELARLQFDLFSNSSTGLANLNATIIGQIVVPLPPLPEQTRIAAFLDRETAKIDGLVAEQQRLIDLLKEKRQAVISHAVTKGLNPQAPMKPSGIEWLGDVPKHWEVTRMSRVTVEIGDGLHGTPTYVDESEYRFINGNNLVSGSIVFNESTRCVSESEFNKHRTDLGLSTVLLSINGTIGNIALYRGERIMLGKSAAYINCAEGLDREFLCWFLQTAFIRCHFECAVTGTTISNLSLESIRHIPLTLPPMTEQAEIVACLIGRIEEFDSLLAEAQRAIDLLQERRTALISAAVTGRIDVRHLSGAGAA